MALSPMDLAAELMLAFGPDGPKATITVNRGGTNQRQLVKWLLRQHELTVVKWELMRSIGGRAAVGACRTGLRTFDFRRR